jgi:hypothetical protein
LYFYPLVSVDVTRRVATNVEAGKIPGFGPPNMFHSFAAFPTADFKTVVRPNFNTLYSSAFLGMTKEPMIVSAPDTGCRYYLLPMLDMWTDVFASPGWRTTGTQAGNFLITPPGWTGDTPSGMTRIDAPTPYVWIIGRTKTDGPQDYDAVHKIQAGYKITPGREQGHEKAKLAHTAGVARIRIFNPAAAWPDCKEKGDISDWITEGGGTHEKLLEIVETLPDWQPTPENADERTNTDDTSPSWECPDPSLLDDAVVSCRRSRSMSSRLLGRNGQRTQPTALAPMLITFSCRFLALLRA